MSDEHGARNGARLRLARQARGFSQQQLAAMAGVSRQAVSADRLASPTRPCGPRWTGASPGRDRRGGIRSFSPAPQVMARPVAPLGGEEARVTLAPVGDGLVALPLSGATVSRAGFLPAAAWPPAARAVNRARVSRYGRSGRRGQRSWPRAATRRCRCWKPRSGCSTRRSRSAGGPARAGKRSG